uniref:Uncharacterized protein n=1 Tax=Oryza sativa subsp. japonica TaxID=39947 RepID=Q6K3K6_ORYSJ|nr:hypothetical protein [Oryza sativa Japonica Group]
MAVIMVAFSFLHLRLANSHGGNEQFDRQGMLHYFLLGFSGGVERSTMENREVRERMHYVH